jgi:transcriptional regulator GlxA family with amidase domain
MEKMKTVFFLFDDMTALDAVGPFEVLRGIPDSEVIFASLIPGEINCKGGLKLISQYAIKEISEAGLLIIPGGSGVHPLLENARLLEWINTLHCSSLFTVSVCTGSLLLGAAGILKGLKATTHWNHLHKLEAFGAEPVKSRYVIDGKVITAAGVSAGIDMSLKLVSLIKNETFAKLIQLGIEYDPDPPFDTGSPDKVSPQLLELFLKANSAPGKK